MVSVLASSVVDHGFEPWSGQSKDNKIGICCDSPLSMQYLGAKTGWLRMKLMYPSGTTYL